MIFLQKLLFAILLAVLLAGIGAEADGTFACATVRTFTRA